jgi:apolipoprotein N-acyltransferase
MREKVFNLRKNNLYNLLTLLAGGLLSLAFAPFNFFWLSILCPAFLLFTWIQSQEKKQIILGSFLFGFGFFGTGVSWVYVSIHYFGGVDIIMTAFITLLFVTLLSSLFILQGLCFYYFSSRQLTMQTIILFSTLWALFEWIREWLFTGFPWLYLAYSQVNSPLAGFIPVLGVFGTAWIIASCSGLLIYFFYAQGKKRFFSMVLFIFIWILGGLLHTIHWTHKINSPINVALVQGDIPQSLKWNPDAVVSTLTTYKNLTQKNWNDLIIWPEAAIPLTLNDAQDFLSTLNDNATEHHSNLITGIPIQLENQDAYWNAAISIGDGSGIYAKRHLVPFGEYIPLYTIFGNFMKMLNIPFPDSVPGSQKQVGLTAKIDQHTIIIGTFICYEIAYSNLLYSDLPQSELLINISNDDWFGHSAAAAQQLQIAQTRALQSGRYLLSSANDGITAIVDDQGKSINILPRFIPGVLTGTAYAMKGTTPWAIWGDIPLILLLFLMLGYCWMRR